MNWKKGLLMYIAISIIGFYIGAAIATYIFFGTLTLIGLIVLIESWHPLKYIVERGSHIIDLIIFAASAVAMVKLGVTISAGLTVAGLGFSFIYGPYVRARRAKRELERIKRQRYAN